MRRLLPVLVVLGLGALVLYRRRSINHWEQTLDIGRHRRGRQPSSAPSS